MGLLVRYARQLVTGKNLGRAAVSFQPRKFASSTSKSQEARVQVTFTTADAPVPVYHGLRRVPTSWFAVSQNGAGTIYNDLPFQADSRTLVVKCDTANVVAELIVR